MKYEVGKGLSAIPPAEPGAALPPVPGGPPGTAGGLPKAFQGGKL
jgi:hypothetical protein